MGCTTVAHGMDRWSDRRTSCYAPAVPSPSSPAALRRVRRRILEWYAEAHRDFPWRGITDPYAVLVSEVMLQQTQASRVAQRFPRFIRRFPTAAALAAAPERAVLAEWSGLGYNRRALSLRRTAAVVAATGWPRDPAELERLPAIGRYTARAVASLAFGVPVGVVDTNVRRWLVRRFGLDPAGSDAGPAALQSLADALARPGRGTVAGRGGGVDPRDHGVRRGHLHAAARRRAEAARSGAAAPRATARLASRWRGSPASEAPAGRCAAPSCAAWWRAPTTRSHCASSRHRHRPGVGVPPGAFDDAIGSLEADRLVHRAGPRLRLGPREDAGPPGTIGA